MFGKDASLALHKSTLICLGFLVAITGCEGQPLGLAEDPPQTTGQAAGEEGDQGTALGDNLATRVLTCKVVDKADSATQTDWFARYAVDSMTRMLDKYPSLAAYAGLSSVSSCEEAIAYARAYDEYAARHPDFERVPDPLVASGAANVGARKILPRLKIRGGNPDSYDTYYDFASGKPSPVVRIRDVYWLANKSTARFTDLNGSEMNEFCEWAKWCSATFLNKNWLLTAAHCMQNVKKQSVRENPDPPADPNKPFPYCLNADGTQPPRAYPPNTLRGETSWIILWPSNKPEPNANPFFYNDHSEPYNQDYPHLYMGSPITGFRAYQHPHPLFRIPQGPSDTSGYGHDVALLGIDPIARPEEYFPPDMARQGGTVYIKAHSTSDPPDQTLFSMAGYGIAADAFGAPNGNTGRLNMALAPPNLSFGSPFVTGTVISGLGSTGLCGGDSGGPLWKLYKNPKDPSVPPVGIQYGVASHGIDVLPHNEGCAGVGDSLYWVRLNATDDTISWVNKEMGERTSEGKKFSECRLIVDKANVMGDVYQCWGEPCGDLAGELKCPSGKTCIGGATSLQNIWNYCEFCPGKLGNCDCVVGQCVDDVGKSAQAGTGAP